MDVSIWANRRRVYLGVYMRGKRREMPEGLIIAGDKAVGKKAARLAEIARAKRTRRVFSEEWGPVDPAAEKQTLYDYIDGMAG